MNMNNPNQFGMMNNNPMGMMNNKPMVMMGMMNNPMNNIQNNERKLEIKTMDNNLKYFFRFISFSDDDDKLTTMKGTKIIVNYYNLIKTPVYLNLDLEIKQLIQIFIGKYFIH